MGEIKSRASSAEYRAGWERTFGGGMVKQAEVAFRQPATVQTIVEDALGVVDRRAAGREVAQYVEENWLRPVVGFDGIEKATRLLKMSVLINPNIPEGELHLIDPVTERVLRVVNLSGIE